MWDVLCFLLHYRSSHFSLKALRGRTGDLKITYIFILEFHLGGVLQSLHLWLQTPLLLVWISFSIIMPHYFMQHRSTYSDLKLDHYFSLNMSLFELCRTPQVGGQSVWRDVSYWHFPSWDLNSITLNLLEILVLKSLFLPRGYPSCKVGCSETPFSATASPWCWLPIQSLAQTSVLSCCGISRHQGSLNPYNTLINGWMNTTFCNWEMKNQEDMVVCYKP